MNFVINTQIVVTFADFASANAFKNKFDVSQLYAFNGLRSAMTSPCQVVINVPMSKENLESIEELVKYIRKTAQASVRDIHL